MSGKLYQLGKWVFAHRLITIGIWIVVIAALTVTATNFQKPFDSKIAIPGTEAQTALDKLSESLPAASKASGTVVFAAPEGKTIIENKAAIDAITNEISKLDGVGGVVSPFVAQTISPNGRIAFAQIQLTKVSTEVSDAFNAKIKDVVKNSNTANLQVEIRGTFLQSGGDVEVGPGEIGGIVVAALVLIITFGSLIAAGMPLLIAIIAVVLGILGILTASGFVSISSTTPTLAVMLGLAVGIDYSLFLIVRYIKYLREGTKPIEAAARAVATAGNAIIFAALTVVIALSALAVTGVPFLASMGIFAALTVAIAAATAITLVPALLSFAKLRVLPKKARRKIEQNKVTDVDRISHKTIGYRWVSMIVKQPILVIIVAVIALGAVAFPVTKLHLGLPDDSTSAHTTTQYKAYELLSDGFGPGFNGPLLIVAELQNGLTPTQTQMKIGSILTELKKEKGIVAAVPAGISKDGKTAIFQAYPSTGPNDIETKDVIVHIRENAAQIAGSDTPLSVTGTAAISVDIDTKLSEALPVYLLVVVGLSILILLAVFRSIVVPIKATLGFLLTIAATLGLVVGFFQLGWFGWFTAGPIISFLPIILTGILFGLAMDYQFFLVSGMHEEYSQDKNKDAKQAVVKGFTQGAKVVSAAGIIMISVFGGFIFSHDEIIRSIGFALAAGVFIDAFIVRMTIVPAVMALFGRTAWWLPAWLGKIIPNLSIEGDESKFKK
ncbi:MAG: rane transport protein [Candidatus Saccharibacteria bacterium]|nr:rane transport protein [Candidatus Saccharibacteria bacterium]